MRAIKKNVVPIRWSLVRFSIGGRYKVVGVKSFQNVQTFQAAGLEEKDQERPVRSPNLIKSAHQKICWKDQDEP